MTDLGKPQLRLLTSGIANLDSILGGGFPEYSFNLIAGDPGSGKTTLCHQIIFANATPEGPALYFTIMGEPPLKMLRYQQQFSYFDPAKVNASIHFINLSREVLDSLDKALEMIVGQVEQRNPAFVVVDSFRSLTETTPQGASGQMNLQMFLQRLALDLTSRQTTAYLVGEYTSDEPRDYSLFTMADGILWLSQNVNRNSMVRKIQAVKMRGVGTQPGRLRQIQPGHPVSGGGCASRGAWRPRHVRRDTDQVSRTSKRLRLGLAEDGGRQEAQADLPAPPRPVGGRDAARDSGGHRGG